MRTKKSWIGILVLSLLFCLLSGCGKRQGEGTESIRDKVKEYQGYQRQVGPEEYRLYCYFVERENGKELTKQELEEKATAYANEVNAIFYLANQFDLCEPYSYEVLKLRMEQENELRKVKKEEGMAVYGLEQFSLEQFFLYKLGTVEADLRSFLEKQTDNTVLQEAKAYYEDNKESFRIRNKVVYEVITMDKNEIVSADREMLNFMGDADAGLADFLETGNVQEKYVDNQNEGKREVVIKEIYYSEEGFEANKEASVVAYINQKLYPELIHTVAKNNPVEIRLNIEE